jgi:hypothetical protein
MSNFDLKKYLAEGRLLKEATFYQEMETTNPGWNKDSVMAFVEDEYEKQEDWDYDVSGDYEDHQEYLKDAEALFNELESGSPTVKVGDKISFYAKSDNKWMDGTITGESIMKGSHMFAGNILPNKIPAWEIQDDKFGFTIFYPKYQEGKMFKKK